MSNENVPTPEEREEAKRLYFLNNGMDQRDIANKIDVADSTISSWKQDWEAEKEEQEELQRIVSGKRSDITSDHVYRKAKAMPGVGEKKAQALKDTVEMRDSMLKDPNELYKYAHSVLETDAKWTRHLVMSVFPHLDDPDGTADPGPDPMFEQATQQQNAQPNFNPQSPQQGGGMGQMFQQPQQSGTGNQQIQMMFQMMQQQMKQQQEMIEQMADVQDGGDSEVDVLREELRNLREEMSDDDSIIDQLKEVQEVRELLSEDDDGAQEMEQLVAAFQREISELKQKVESDDGLDVDPHALSGGDSSLATLALLAQSTDMDATAIQSLAGELSEVESDPEVAKKKMDKEIKELEMRAKEERYDTILQAIENSADSVLGILGQATGNGESPVEPASPEERASFNAAQQETVDTEPKMSPAERMAHEELDDREPADERERAEVERVETVEESEPESEPEPEPESEPEEPEQQDPASSIACPGCGKEFDTENAFYGHKSGCDELDGIEQDGAED